MKYLKKFEESKYDLHIKYLIKNNKSNEDSPYKIGDLVKVKDLENIIFVITKVQKKKNVSGTHYFIYDTENIDPDDESGWGWTEGNDIMPVSDSEYKEWLIKKTADKYNL